MCGIIGLWDPALPPSGREALARRMNATQAHRGPDGEGFWWPADGVAPLVLAHRRLAIRGLGEQGAQPMRGATGTLSFNGELFGIEPLRAQLAAAGAAFRGTSDTEVLLHALERWGIAETLARIHGQFAFLWWSDRDRRLCFARDRVGIRPLYYTRSGDRLAVASEQKALLALPWLDPRPNRDAMLRFLAMGRTDDVPGETLLANVASLPPGHWAAFDGRDVVVTRYHRLETTPPRAGEPDLRRELDRAVGEQLVSDVPLGATVSGGLDSSTIVGLADRARLARGDSTTLHLFAYHDARAEQDERRYQQAVLDAVRSPHEVHWVSSSPEALVADFEAYVDHQEEPYADLSSYAEYCLAGEARRQGVKVLLSGLGGDEVFVGYVSFFGPLLLDLLRQGDFGAFRQTIRVAPDVLGQPGAFARPLAAAAYHALPSRVRNGLSALRNARGAGLTARDALRGGADAWQSWHRHDGDGTTNAALRGAIESWCIPRFLLHSDRMGLAHGVEGRVPLLDDGVIRTAFGIPSPARVGADGLKASLRGAVADVLPVAVRERRWKLGFHAPVAVYVAALDAPLRAGHALARDALGGGASFDELRPGARWAWGALGCYLAWARGRHDRAAGIDRAAA
jgi:asparagine synthase (glutamine-hydrolysing)